MGAERNAPRKNTQREELSIKPHPTAVLCVHCTEVTYQSLDSWSVASCVTR